MAQNTSVSSLEIMDLMRTKRINNFEGDQDKEYNANMQIENYDQKRGNLSWIGRRVRKIFAGRGEFEGIVYGADDDAQHKGYRLFFIHYFEDPDDGEYMWAEELVRFVVSIFCMCIFSVKMLIPL